MRRIIRYFMRLFMSPPAAPRKTAREKKLEREWADLLRYEGRPLYGEDKD